MSNNRAYISSTKFESPKCSEMKSDELQNLIRELEDEYYQPAEKCCRKISDYILEMHGGDDAQTASLYSTFCKKLAEETLGYIRLRRDFLHVFSLQPEPMLQQNSFIQQQLLIALEKIQKLLFELRCIVPPIPHQMMHEDWDGEVRLEVQALDDLLTRLFQFEQSKLGTMALGTSATS